MIYPQMNSLLNKTGDVYTLVIVVAKRARELVDGSPALTKSEKSNSEKAVTVAVNELADNKVTYMRLKSGLK